MLKREQVIFLIETPSSPNYFPILWVAMGWRTLAVVQAEAPAEDEVPEVAIRVERNGDRVEEYRQNGRLYMVKVTPERGPVYYLHDTDGNGKLNREDGTPSVTPVYWTLYEWD